MRVQDVIAADKDVLDWGVPKQGGMPPAAFPMSKRKKGGIKFGGNHKWRLVRFRALNETFRILIVYHTLVDEYVALLGMEVGSDTRLLIDFAYHGTHGGWHVHVACGDAHKVPLGVMRGKWVKRLPGARSFSRRNQYTLAGSAMTDHSALQIAANRFNLHTKSTDLFGRRS